MIDLDGLAGVALLFYLYGIFDVLTTDRELVRNLPKWLWFVIVVLFPDLGLMAWRMLGRPPKAMWRQDGTALREQRWTGAAQTPPPEGIDPPAPMDGAKPVGSAGSTARPPTPTFRLPPDLPAAQTARAWLARVAPLPEPPAAASEAEIMAAIAERDRVIAQWEAEAAAERSADEDAHTA